MADTFNENKIVSSDFSGHDITSLEGNTFVGKAEQLKAAFDASVKDIVTPKYNDLIDALQAPSAAGQIGTPQLIPGGVQNVAGQLAYIRNQLNNVVLNQIPDDSVTDVKLSHDAGQALDRLSKAPLLDSPEFTGTPTAPTPDTVDTTQKIATTEYVQNNLIPVAEHMEDTGIHVTYDWKMNVMDFMNTIQRGTWPVTLYGTTTAGTPTYTTQAGYFQRVGNLVNISFTISISAKGDGWPLAHWRASVYPVLGRRRYGIPDFCFERDYLRWILCACHPSKSRQFFGTSETQLQCHWRYC